MDLSREVDLLKSTSRLLKTLFEQSGASELSEYLKPENAERLPLFLHDHTPADLLSLYPVSLTGQELVSLLVPLRPRFYSIASSQRLFPREAHLTVILIHRLINGQHHLGVASGFLTQRAAPQKTDISFYIQPAHHFSLPSDPHTPIILIGTGTGIAPYRAFLQERTALHAPGKNWLFFGERNRQTDFYYEDFWLSLEKKGALRLSCAFSRDSLQKTYVQHLMWQQRKDLWEWIGQGAVLYVCGSAASMAKGVEETFCQIAASEGKLDPKEFLKKMRQEKRYLTDIY
jgi:sulfite reductase (NADPH) flavoprotein alpha-component